MTLTEFLRARIAEDEATANNWLRFEVRGGSPDDDAIRDRVLSECEAKRQIVRLHESWPVLVEQPPTFDRVDTSDPNTFAMRASQQIAWTTQQEYRRIFGSEPPTAPILRALAAVYANHPDCREEWKS